MPNQTYEFTTEDVEYLRHGDTRLIARLYKPKGCLLYTSDAADD